MLCLMTWAVNEHLRQISIEIEVVVVMFLHAFYNYYHILFSFLRLLTKFYGRSQIKTLTRPVVLDLKQKTESD